MTVVKFLPRAAQDLLDLPKSLQQEIREKPKLLGKFPAMGPRLERAYAGYRYFLAGRNQYRIIYKITAPTLVQIAYIRHCKRQIGLRLIHH